MADASDAHADPEHPESEAAEAHYVWQFFLQILLIQRKADPRMLVACFCEKSFSGWDNEDGY